MYDYAYVKKKKKKKHRKAENLMHLIFIRIIVITTK